MRIDTIVIAVMWVSLYVLATIYVSSEPVVAFVVSMGALYMTVFVADEIRFRVLG